MTIGNRCINYLRISITDRCNFRCLYCVPFKKFKVIEHDLIARYEELLRLTKLACEMGITKIRITGGEPFVRKGIFSFLEQVCSIRQIEDISITTNGSKLNRSKIQKLKTIGIKRLNFSLDTLKPDRFTFITGRNQFHKVWDAILTAYELGIAPIKINVVALKGINDDEFTALAELTMKYPFHIRFIEYMPMGEHLRVNNFQFILSQEIKQKLELEIGPLLPIEKKFHDGPAKNFKFLNALGVIGFITPISAHFCSECNRLRLTSRGTLRPCLLKDYEKDILGPMRSGASDRELSRIILASLTQKPSFHPLNRKAPDIITVCNNMTSIGG